MAVEARHLINLFPSHLLGNREMLNSTGNSTNPYASGQIPTVGGEVGVSAPAVMDALLPLYNSQRIGGGPVLQQLSKSTALVNGGCNPPQVSALKDDSGLTFNNSVLPLPWKRNRDSSFATSGAADVGHLISDRAVAGGVVGPGRCASVAGGTSMTFLGEDLSLQMMQHQLEIDRLISLHMEKVRVEMENRRRKQSRRIIDAIEEAMANKLRDKEEQMEKIGKLNWALEERVKSLCVENQIWRDLAQTNKATANALRSNLEQVLAQANSNNANTAHNVYADDVEGGGCRGRVDIAVVENAESCCGSSTTPDDGEDEAEGGPRWRKVARCTGEEEGKIGNYGSSSSSSRRMCRRCGGGESSVLLLPCRHLCLCTACGPYVDICPVCNSSKNASVHVNLS